MDIDVYWSRQPRVFRRLMSLKFVFFQSEFISGLRTQKCLFNIKCTWWLFTDVCMVHMDKVRSHFANQHESNVILCLEISTKIFKNRCRGGHQSVAKGLTVSISSFFIANYIFIRKYHHKITRIMNIYRKKLKHVHILLRRNCKTKIDTFSFYWHSFYWRR